MKRKGLPITEDAIKTKLGTMMGSDPWQQYIKKGAPAAHSYSQWGKLTSAEKAAAFRKARRAFIAVLGILLVCFAAASDAWAAFTPIFAVSTDDAQSEYRAAIDAILRGEYDKAHVALFGPYERCAYDDDPPKGLICKLLKGPYESGGHNRVLEIEDELRRKFDERINALRSGKPLPPCSKCPDE